MRGIVENGKPTCELWMIVAARMVPLNTVSTRRRGAGKNKYARYKKTKQSAIKCLTSSQVRSVYSVVSRGGEEKQLHMICMRKRSF